MRQEVKRPAAGRPFILGNQATPGKVIRLRPPVPPTPVPQEFIGPAERIRRRLVVLGVQSSPETRDRFCMAVEEVASAAWDIESWGTPDRVRRVKSLAAAYREVIEHREGHLPVDDLRLTFSRITAHIEQLRDAPSIRKKSKRSTLGAVRRRAIAGLLDQLHAFFPRLTKTECRRVAAGIIEAVGEFPFDLSPSGDTLKEIQKRKG